MTTTPTDDEALVERRVHELVEAARMYEASCRLGGKDQEFASRNLDKARSAAIVTLTAAQPVEGGWRPIETAPKDGNDVLLSNGHWVFEATSLPDGRFIRTKDKRETAPSNCRYWRPHPKEPPEITTLKQGSGE